MNTKIKILTYILFFIYFVSVSLVSAQDKQLYFSRITTENGLSSNVVNCTLQDKYGFIWFGTDNGLNRYDGHSVLVIKHNSTDIHSISSNRILTMLRDSRNRIWLGTDNGLNQFDPLTLKCARFLPDSTNKNSIVGKRINNLYEDSKGRIWVLTDVINCLNAETGKFTHYQHSQSNSFSPNATAGGAIVEDRSGKFWVGTWTDLEGIDTFRYETGKFYHLPFKGRDQRFGNLSPELVSCIYKDSRQNLWFGCFTGLYFYNSATGLFRYFHYYDKESNFNASISSINEDIYGNIWLATIGNGLFIYEPQIQKFYHFLNVPVVEETLSDNRINHIFKDNNGTMWIATRNGVSVADVFTNQFGLLQYKNNVGKNYSLAQAFLVEDNDGNLWTDIVSGILAYGGKREGYTIFNQETKEFLPPQTVKGYNSIKKCAINSKGDVLLNAESAVYKVNGNNLFDEIFRFTENKGEINNLIFDKRNPELFWINNPYFFLQFDMNKKKLVKNYSENNAPHLAHTDFLDSNNNFWYVSSRSNNFTTQLFRFDTKNEQTTVVKHDSIADILSINGNYEGQIYVCSKNGFFIYDSKTNRLKKYNHILPYDNYLNAAPDRQGNIWLTYKYGICRLNINSNTVERFDCKSDIPSVNEVPYFGWQNVILSQKTGQIYISTLDGILYFNPEQIRFNSKPPDTYITDFKLFNQSISLDTSLIVKKKIVLQYNQNFFTLHFAVLNYSNSEKNTYQYILNNFDKQCIHSSSPEAKYTSVAPGTYIFEVKGCNNKGIWSQTAAYIEIVILPPFWLTWWAYTIYLILFVLAIYGIVKWNISRLQKDKKRLEHIVTQRTTELKDKNKKLKQQKSEILFQKEIAQGQAEILQKTLDKINHLVEFKENMTSMIVHDLKNPLNYIITKNEHTQTANTGKQMLNMVMNILDIQKFEDAKMKLNPNIFTLNQSFDNAVKQVEYLLEEKKLTLISKLHPQIGAKYDTEIIERIFINILTNAIKYTPHNEKISVKSVFIESENAKCVKIEIYDRGKGIPADFIPKIFDKFSQAEAQNIGFSRSTGLGLTFCKLAIEAHKGNIGVESKADEGSMFWFSLPLESVSEITDYQEKVRYYDENRTQLSETDKQYLRKISNKLKSTEFYEVSELKSIMLQIDETKSSEIAKWKIALQKAIDTFNEEEFEGLVGLCD